MQMCAMLTQKIRTNGPTKAIPIRLSLCQVLDKNPLLKMKSKQLLDIIAPRTFLRGQPITAIIIWGYGEKKQLDVNMSPPANLNPCDLWP